MKNRFRIASLTQSIIRPGRLAMAGAAFVWLAAMAMSAAAEVIPPAALPYGLSYEEWSAKWWQWNLGQATNRTELVGEPGICNGDASRVRFLAGAPGPITTTRKVTVPEQTPLFFTILSVWVDNSGCPTFTSFTPAELAEQAAGQWSAVTVTTCTIDGVPVAGLSNSSNTVYRVQAPAFSYTTAAKDNVLAGYFGAPCIPGNMTIYPAVADGVYLMLTPLSVGKHTIHYVGVVGPVSAPFVKEDLTYDITVERDCDRR